MAGKPAVPTIAANSAVIHHVSLPVRDVGRSVAFYEDVLGLRRIERPNFSFEGAWFAIGPSQQLHLIKDTGSTFREGKGLTPLDIHFAIRVRSYRDALRHLVTKGYRKEGTPDATGANSMRVTSRADAGFPQIYIMDPDRNMIEINAEALDVSVSEIDSLLA